MREVHLVVNGIHQNSYKVEKAFDNITDAERYIEYMQFHTSNKLWINTINSYGMGEFKYPELEEIPMILAQIDSNNNVLGVRIADNARKKKEDRFDNLFTFYLPKRIGENLQEYLTRAKRIAIEKQSEYLANKK